ncbi:MAG: multiheme c-type cytochrome [Betaproteobacteria bacterium]
MNRAVMVVVGAALLALPPPAGAAPQSRCVECHFANFSDVPAREHLGDWAQSAHAKHGVGCEWCHGGDASTFVPADAHKGVVGSGNAASWVYRSNLPRTCAPCHAGETQAFARSFHNTLLSQGDDRRAPTCSSCHGAMRARVPSPAALENECAGCHTASSPRAAYPVLARLAVEQIAEVRTTLEHVQYRLQKMKDPEARQRLWAQQTLAIATLNGAAEAFHSFDFTTVAERLRLARQRADELDRQTR